MVLYYTLSFIPQLYAAQLHNNNNKCSEAGKTHRLTIKMRKSSWLKEGQPLLFGSSLDMKSSTKTTVFKCHCLVFQIGYT